MIRPQTISFPTDALDLLLPMHLLVDAAGRIVSAGATLGKMMVKAATLAEEVFVVTRPTPGDPLMKALHHAAVSGERIGLKTIAEPDLGLRGHVVTAGEDRLLVNMGFGIGLAEAVEKLDLTANDFAPSELAMELLFLHEANRGVMHELSLFNSRLDAAREAAEIEAHTDVLTGLKNRRGLEAALEKALLAMGGCDDTRTDGGFALLHLDLDFFKDVNDRFGHAAGDEVLRHVARVLRDVTRSADTAARIGGDEFVLLLRGTGDAVSLRRLGERIIGGIRKPVLIDGVDCRVSASLGIVTSHAYPTPSAQQMQADADAALYRSKHEGRDRLTIGDLAVHRN